ncbi:hypothetical protein Tco_0206050, partial [Tanacetum coccineum]
SEPRTSPAGHSFKEAVLGPKDNNMSSIVKRIQLAKDGFLRSRLENCCVGKAKNFHVLQNAWDILKNNDKSKCNAKYVGGLSFLFEWGLMEIKSGKNI